MSLWPARQDIGQPDGPPRPGRDGQHLRLQDLSPRIGLTYQLTKDGKTVARASYGRYYMPLTVEYLRRYGPDAPLVTTHPTAVTAFLGFADANGDGIIDLRIERRRAAARHVYGT